MTDQELIWNSLEAAAEQCEDLAPLVYAKFFAVKPQVSEIFANGTREAPNIPMGNMIYELVVLVTDGIDNGTLDSNTMSTLMTHIGWGIDLAMYQSLLDALTATVRDACGNAWSDDTMRVWHRRTTLIMDSLRANLVIIDRQLAGEEYASH
jgi:hemoglobin-like flavoprotein